MYSDDAIISYLLQCPVQHMHKAPGICIHMTSMMSLGCSKNRDSFTLTGNAIWNFWQKYPSMDKKEPQAKVQHVYNTMFFNNNTAHIIYIGYNTTHYLHILYQGDLTLSKACVSYLTPHCPFHVKTETWRLFINFNSMKTVKVRIVIIQCCFLSHTQICFSLISNTLSHTLIHIKMIYSLH